jgi:hypothetical protein
VGSYIQNQESANTSEISVLPSVGNAHLSHLQLLGEFDGSAACELIKKVVENARQIAPTLH